jgi:hypothetical protein
MKDVFGTWLEDDWVVVREKKTEKEEELSSLDYWKYLLNVAKETDRELDLLKSQEARVLREKP